MDRNVRARVDEIFNSLIENVNEDARAGIASYIAQLARIRHRVLVVVARQIRSSTKNV